nr:MAG TPA: hypothetical protein [Caudoviricetes sp.]
MVNARGALSSENAGNLRLGNTGAPRQLCAANSHGIRTLAKDCCY